MTVILRICPLLLFIFSIVYLVFIPFSFGFYHSNLVPKASPEAKKDRLDLQKERQEVRQAKLDAKKLKVCQTKEKVIKNRLESLTALVTNQQTKFDKIATRVENFYTAKVLPTGKTLANYDALAADIDAKKAAVDSNLATAKTNADSFACGADDPKGALSGFREDMQSVKSALKEYRTSIKNLIVAVKGL